jgi:hypothetical protein
MSFQQTGISRKFQKGNELEGGAMFKLNLAWDNLLNI